MDVQIHLAVDRMLRELGHYNFPIGQNSSSHNLALIASRDVLQIYLPRLPLLVRLAHLTNEIVHHGSSGAAQVYVPTRICSKPIGRPSYRSRHFPQNDFQGNHRGYHHGCHPEYC